jgi:Putative F0F1-ATPase subunit Ca2+/Mg2+ transporter
LSLGLDAQPKFVTKKRFSPHPMAVAMEWVAKITTVALEMFLPAAGGAYLDRRLGTNFWTLAGVVLGFVVGMWHLLAMTRGTQRRDKPDDEDASGGTNDG